MRKFIITMVLLMMLASLAGCKKEPQKENNIADIETELPDAGGEKSSVMVQVVTPSPEKIALQEKREHLKEKLAGLEQVDWRELTCYADEETSLLNSNLLVNFGYMAFDEKGNIYFTDRNIGGIFVSDGTGKNRRQFTPDSGYNLQIAGDWLYYLCGENSGVEGEVKRIHLETGEVESISEELYTSFVVLGEKLYLNGDGGFYVAEWDGTNITMLFDESLTMRSLQVTDDGLWLGNAFDDDAFDLLFDGKLLCYDETKDSLCFVEENAVYPLLAGNWLCVWDYFGGKGLVWNLETGEESCLDAYYTNCVSDGKYLYCGIGRGSDNIFYRWDGEKQEELFRVQAELYVHTMYLTPDKLYWMQTNATGKRWFWEFWYYDLGTSKIGQVY